MEFTCRVPPEALEAAAELLRQGSPGGLVIEDGEGLVVTLKAFLPLEEAEQARDLRRELRSLPRHFPGMSPPSVTTRVIHSEDWAEAWKTYFRPIRVGQRLVVVPAWETWTFGPEDVVIRIDPGMAFGTGDHPTTRLCLEALETLVTGNACVLDLGTGSGILGIAAAKLGAGRVFALDTDPVAVAAARDNAVLNQVSGIMTIEQKELACYDGSPPDLIVANLNLHLLVGLAPLFASTLGFGGLLVLSGVLGRDARECEETYKRNGFSLIERRSAAEWSVFILQRASPSESVVEGRLESAEPA